MRNYPSIEKLMIPVLQVACNKVLAARAYSNVNILQKSKQLSEDARKITSLKERN